MTKFSANGKYVDNNIYTEKGEKLREREREREREKGGGVRIGKRGTMKYLPGHSK